LIESPIGLFWKIETDELRPISGSPEVGIFVSARAIKLKLTAAGNRRGLSSLLEVVRALFKHWPTAKASFHARSDDRSFNCCLQWALAAAGPQFPVFHLYYQENLPLRVRSLSVGLTANAPLSQRRLKVMLQNHAADGYFRRQTPGAECGCVGSRARRFRLRTRNGKFLRIQVKTGKLRPRRGNAPIVDNKRSGSSLRR